MSRYGAARHQTRNGPSARWGGVACLIVVATAAFGGSSVASPGPVPSLEDEATALKLDIRELTSYIEGCYAERGDYTRCDSKRELDLGVLVPYGARADQVRIERATVHTFKIVGRTRARVRFRLTRTYSNSRGYRRTCAPRFAVGCHAGTW